MKSTPPDTVPAQTFGTGTVWLLTIMAACAGIVVFYMVLVNTGWVTFFGIVAGLWVIVANFRSSIHFCYNELLVLKLRWHLRRHKP